MESAPRSSFIPKQVIGNTQKSAHHRRVFSVFGVISFVLLGIAIAAGGGLFLYKTYLQKSLDTQKAALATEYAKFDEENINTVRAFDEQLQAAKFLLDHHASPSKIFDALEVNTKKSVQYTDFQYEKRPSGGVTVTINGITNEFAKVSLQWMQYLHDTVLADVTMTQVGLAGGDGGTAPSASTDVNFSLIANIDGVNIPYTAPATVVPPVEEATSTASSTVESNIDTTTGNSANTESSGSTVDTTNNQGESL